MLLSFSGVQIGLRSASSDQKINVNKSVDDGRLSLVLCEWHFETCGSAGALRNVHSSQGLTASRELSPPHYRVWVFHFWCLAAQYYGNLPTRISDRLTGR